jgi:anti-sigma factor RsiW
MRRISRNRLAAKGCEGVKVVKSIGPTSLVDTVTRDDLDAFADNALPAGRAAVVAEYVGTHPDAAARIDTVRRMNAWLREAAEGELAIPVPQDLITRARDLAAALQDASARDTHDLER